MFYTLFYKHITKNISKGQMLIELVLVIGLTAIILPALLTGLIASREGKPQQEQNLQATALLQETVSAVRQARDNDWTTITVDGIFHPVIINNEWTLASGSATINGLTQQAVINDVHRNSSGIIVTMGGTLDPSTKQVVITISWTQPYSSSITSTVYLTRTTNFTHTNTTVTDFIGGTLTGTVVASTSGTQISNDGQVQLGAGGAGGNWCSPQNTVLQTFNLPGQGVVQNISATSSATQYAYAYTTTGGNSSGDAVDGLTIDNGTAPPTVTNPSSNSEAKAYGIFVNNDYVYFNENNTPNHTVRIARTSDLSDVGYFDISHTTGSSIFVSGTTGYTAAQSTNTLYSFSVSSILGTSSQPQLGSVSLDGIGNKVIVVGTNAYVATSNTTNQLDIINVANPSSLIKTKSINLGNGEPAIDVFVNPSQTYAYIVTQYTPGQNDFFSTYSVIRESIEEILLKGRENRLVFHFHCLQNTHIDSMSGCSLSAS